MELSKIPSLIVATLFGAAMMGNVANAASSDETLAHMGHVTSEWTDTPDNMGLLPTAIAEAKIAAFHAGLAAQQPENLGWMKIHAKHVLHAVDAGMIAKGPGLGYGVKKAAAGTAKHIGFAAGADGASGNVKAHSVHVSSSAENTVDRVNAIVALAGQVEAASNATEAAPLVVDMNAIAQMLLNGHDANGDGKITWMKGEGGLNVADKHMGFMRKGEGL